MKPLPISGMTLTCAAGTGLASIRKALVSGQSGLRSNDFPGCELETWIGRVGETESVAMPKALSAFDCRNNQLAILALNQDDFRDRVAACAGRVGTARIACIIGTSTAGIGTTEQAYRALAPDGGFPEQYRLPRVHTPHTSAACVAASLGLGGPVMTVSTACSSSAKVFASAARLIEAGWADAAVVGGVDSLCLSILYGFSSLELVSDAPCRPFDRDRRGLNLGEAAGFVLLERDPRETAGTLLGCGETSDAHHMAAPHPAGRGAVAAMNAALESAGLAPVQIGYINCHGTATRLNDRVEADAIREVFPDPPPASSTKGWTGHTLGAAGITEAVLGLVAMQDGVLPASLNCRSVEAEGMDFIVTEPLPRAVDAILSNSFGFGGSNCSLILGRA